MIEKVEFISYVESLFKKKKVIVETFDSGCVMIDVYVNEMDLLVVLVEDGLIGISLIKDYPNNMVMGTTSDFIFTSNEDAKNYLIELNIN